MIDQLSAIIITATISIVFGTMGCFIGFYMFMNELSKIKHGEAKQ